MSGAIANYWASLGFRVAKNETSKVDRYLKNLTKKLEKFNKGLNKSLTLNLAVNQKGLEKNLGNALDIASKKVVFEVTNFAVNERALQAAMLRATRRLRGGGGVNSLGGFGTTIINNRILSSQEWDRRQAVQHANRMEYLRNRQSSVSTGGGHRGNARTGTGYYSVMHAGGAAGAIARFGVAGIPFIGGAYGLSTMNTFSQELQANQIALEAVAGNRAGEYRDYLSNLGDKLGMTTRALQPSFTQYLASAQGTALEGNIKGDFEAFTQYGAVMGLNPEDMKGSLRALTQMVSKQQIYAEELRGQLGERMPAAVRLMAEAVTGGDTKALTKMMERGELDPNKALPEFFKILRQRSESFLPNYYESSRFAQGKFQKATEDQMKLFGEKGGDKGFFKLFDSLSVAMKESSPLVESLAKGFDTLSDTLSFFILLPQSIQRALQGRDSWFKDFFGEDAVENIRNTVKNMDNAWENFKAITNKIGEGWGMILPSLGEFLTGWISIFTDTIQAATKALSGDFSGAESHLKTIRSTLGMKEEDSDNINTPTGAVNQAVRSLMFLPLDAFYGTKEFAASSYDKAAFSEATFRQFHALPADNFYRVNDDLAGYRDHVMQQAMAAQEQVINSNSQVTFGEGSVVINTASTDAEGIANDLLPMLNEAMQRTRENSLKKALEAFPQTE